MRSATSAASTRVFTNTHAAPSYPAQGCAASARWKRSPGICPSHRASGSGSSRTETMTVNFSSSSNPTTISPLRGRMPFTLSLPQAVSAMLDAMADTKTIDAAWTKDLSWSAGISPKTWWTKPRRTRPKSPQDSGMPSTSTSSIASWTLRPRGLGSSLPFPSPYSPGLPRKVRSSSTSRP